MDKNILGENMKKIYLILIILFMLIGGVIAADLTARNITPKNETKIELNKVGISSIKVTDVTCKNNVCSFIVNGLYGADSPKVKMGWILYNDKMSEEEVLTAIDLKLTSMLNNRAEELTAIKVSPQLNIKQVEYLIK
jgi:hypothetical protein